MTLEELLDVEEKLHHERMPIIPRHTRLQHWMSAMSILFDPRANLPPSVRPGSRQYPQTGVEYLALYHPDTFARF
jgi:hypothetical protein